MLTLEVEIFGAAYIAKVSTFYKTKQKKRDKMLVISSFVFVIHDRCGGHNLEVLEGSSRWPPFMGSDECPLGHFNPAFGSSHSASSAYQKWPTWHSDLLQGLDKLAEKHNEDKKV